MKMNQLANWTRKQTELSRSRDHLVIRGASAETAIAFYQPEQDKLHRQYDGIMRGRQGRNILVR